MPALRRYTVSIEKEVEVSATSPDEALAKGTQFIEGGNDSVHTTNTWIREA